MVFWAVLNKKNPIGKLRPIGNKPNKLFMNIPSSVKTWDVFESKNENSY